MALLIFNCCLAFLFCFLHLAHILVHSTDFICLETLRIHIHVPVWVVGACVALLAVTEQLEGRNVLME